MKNKPIVFFGTEDFSLTSLHELVEAGFLVQLVVTKPDFRSGRGQKLTAPSVKTYALERGIRVLQPVKLSEITSEVKELNHPAGVLVSYGKIVPQNIIDLFVPGIINVHPSLLPQYRGPSPIESAIINSDKQTGVSIMQLSAQMDAGPVYSQVTDELYGTETQAELYRDLAIIGAHELIKVLPSILDGSLQPTAQDESRATYCKLLHKDQAFFNPKTLTAVELEARIRAYQNFPKTKYTIDGRTITITKGHTSNTPSDTIDIRCSDGAYLVIDQLVAPSGRTMSAKDYRNGYAAG